MTGPHASADAAPLHPWLAHAAALAAAAPPIASLTVQQARTAVSARLAAAVAGPHVASVTDQWIEAGTGALHLRIYRPDGAGSALPLTVFFHGGGFVLMDLETHDAVCRQLCRASCSIVIAVDYRLAPEHAYPAAPDDTLAAVRWVAQHAALLGGDPARIAVAGDSAGGNLAIVTAMRVRDEGGPRLAAQLLFYPVADGPTADWPSRTLFGEGFGLTRGAMDWFWGHYLPTPNQGSHPHVAPLRAASLAGLPPAWVATAGYDFLRDEGEALAKRLNAAGGQAELHRYADLNHAFLHWTDQVPSAAQALAEASAWLREALHSSPRIPAPVA